MQVSGQRQALAILFAILMVASMVGQGVAATPARAVAEEDGASLDSDGLYTQLNSSSTPNVTTQEATDITEFRSTLRGQVDPPDVDSAYFEWRMDGANTWNQTQGLDVSDQGNFSTELSGLNDDTTYEFRAVAESDGNRTVGDTLTFVTAENQFAGEGYIRPDADREIFLWERFIFPFRADPSTQAGTEMTSTMTNINVESLGTGPVPLDKREVAVYNESESIDLNFQSATGADTSRFNNTQVDLLAVESEFTADDGVSQISRFETLMESNESTAQIAATTQLDDNGEASFTFDPSAAQGAGDYVFFVVNNGSVTVENEDVTQFTNTRILGMDFATVQDTNSSVSTNRPEYRPGETVEIDTDANFEDERITQAVVLYNEAEEDNSLGSQTVTLVVSGELDEVSTDNVSVETSFKGVRGVRRSEDGVLVRGQPVSERDEVGLFEVADVFSFLGDQIGTDLDTQTGDTVLNASMVAQADTGPETTFEVETVENFTAGEYSVVHIAEGNETGQMSTDKQTITISETLNDYITVDIDEDTTDAQVASGDSVTVNATIQNIGDEPAQFEPIVFEVNGEQASSRTVSLSSNESQNVSFTYSNTDNTDDLNVRVDAFNYEGSDSEDSIAIDVVDDAFYDVGINEADSTLDVVEGETAVVNTTIENTVDLPGSQTVNLTVGGEVVDQQSIDLEGEEATTVDFEWNTTDGDAGEVEAVVDSGDDSVSTNVTVREPAFFDVTNLDPESLTVENGSQIDVSADITNTGGVNVTQDVELRLDDQTVATQNVTLGPNESTPVTFADVPITETGEFTHGVYTDDANATGTLTVVEEFATSIDVSLAGPTPAREQTSATYDISANVTSDAGEETLENITVDFGADSVDLSNIAAGDVTVQIAGDARSVDIIDQGDTLRLDLSQPISVGSGVSAGDDINVTVNNVVNPTGGTYELEVSLLEADSRFTTDSVEYTTETAADAVAAIEAEPTDPDVNVTVVEFNASASQGAGDLQYEWDFTGDGVIDETTQDPVVNHTYSVSSLGEYEASVRVVDELNENDTASVTIDVGDTIPPTAALEGPGTVPIETQFELNASGSTDNHRIEEYAWEVVDNETDETVFTDTTTGATLSTTVDETGNYTASVTVSDASGNANTTSVDLVVEDLPNLVGDVNTPSRQRLQDGVNVTANVSNFGNQPAETAFDWTFTATGSPKGNDTSETFQRNGTINPDFEPDAVVTVSDGFESEFQTWAEENQIVGEVTFELATDPADAVDETITQDNNDTETTRVTYVELDTEAAVRPTVVAGSNVTLRSFVRNLGTTTNDATNGTIAVENETDDVIRNTNITVQPIVPGGRQKNTTMEEFEEGDYTLNVSVSDEDLVFNGSLNASAAFTVEPYNLTINEPVTRVPNEVGRGEEFTVGLAYETNARDDVNVSIDLPDGLELAAGQSENRTVDGRADRVNFVRWTVVAANASDNHEISFDVADTRDRVDETDSYSENVTVPVNWVSVSNTSSVTISDGDLEAQTESFVWNQTTDEHNLTISAQAGSNGRTLQGLEYLVRYPYGCVEQTTSAFLGALNTHQYYEDRDGYNISDDRYERINNSIEQGVNRLADGGARGQRPDGGWDMWGYGSSDTFFSAYALYGVSQVENDQTYRNQSTIPDSLDNTDFDAAVTWLNEESQNDDGSFDARYYIRDDAAMTGFTIVSLNETSKHDRISSSTQDNITEVYANASEYLVNAQVEDGPDAGSWSDGDGRATGLAVWGLQIAMEEGAYTEANVTRTEMEDAINNGTAYLLESQFDNGRWEAAESPYWNARGENSRHTGYVLLALDSVNASNLDDVSESNVTTAIEDGAEYLTTVYERGGSWGYPRSTVIALEALTQVTEVPADRTVQIEISNSSSSDPVINRTLTVDATGTPEEQIQYTLGDDKLDQLRNASDPVHTVTVTDASDSGPGAGDGTVIVAVENEQLVDGDELGGDDE